MTIIPFSTDEEAIRIANDCPFGLGSNIFCKSQARARAIASQVEAGMAAINDFASTYTCQSLPFGGVKHSGFGRFGGGWYADWVGLGVVYWRGRVPRCGAVWCSGVMSLPWLHASQ
jgi:acyl-CoA reductase-like NAD-dependent aldehyde dehydrogenase